MQSHIGLVITVLSIIAIAAIAAVSTMQRRRQERRMQPEPRLGELNELQSFETDSVGEKRLSEIRVEDARHRVSPEPREARQTRPASPPRQSSVQEDLIVFHVMANQKPFVGYELLQALLAAGLRFGEMNIFHRYQEQSGKGPILFSLASATEPGTFDIQNMGGFSSNGLSLFLRCSNNCGIDTERYELLVKTARQLCDDLDARLLDESFQPLSEKKVEQLRRRLAGEQYNIA